MSRRPSWFSMDPLAPTLCYCPSCMRLGGARRAAMRSRDLGEVRRLVVNRKTPVRR